MKRNTERASNSEICSPKIVYILGRRHCGSTILDIVLGNTEEGQSVGELIFGLSRFPNEPVSGGGTVSTNPFWNQVKAIYDRKSGTTIEIAASKLHSAFALKSLPWLLLASKNSSRVRELSELLEYLYEAIGEVSGKPVIIDSGKRITQALFMARFFPRARIVHLVRNPISVMSSHLKRARKGETIAFLGRRVPADKVGWLMYTYLACNWSIGTGLAWFLEKCHSKICFRLRFEDFLSHPLATIERLGEVLELDVQEVLAKMNGEVAMSCSVNIGGNRMRFEPQLRVDSARAKAAKLSRGLRMWVLFISLPLLGAYGYFASS